MRNLLLWGPTYSRGVESPFLQALWLSPLGEPHSGTAGGTCSLSYLPGVGALGCILALFHQQGVAGESLHDGVTQALPPRDRLQEKSRFCYVPPRGVALHEALAGQLLAPPGQRRLAGTGYLKIFWAQRRRKYDNCQERGRSSSMNQAGSACSGPSCQNHLYPQTDPPLLLGSSGGKFSVGHREVCVCPGTRAPLGAVTRHQLGLGGGDARPR